MAALVFFYGFLFITIAPESTRTAHNAPATKLPVTQAETQILPIALAIPSFQAFLIRDEVGGGPGGAGTTPFGFGVFVGISLAIAGKIEANIVTSTRAVTLVNPNRKAFRFETGFLLASEYFF
jgi:hypothetical protein